MKKLFFIKSVIVMGLLSLVPVISDAQIRTVGVDNGSKNLSWLIGLIITYLNMILGLLMAVAVVFFVFYVIKYFMLPNENRSEAGNYVLYSVIGFFVILSFWGLVNIVQNTFQINNRGNNSWDDIENLFPR